MGTAVIVGARPHFIKISPLKFDLIIHTGQHYSDSMSENFLREFGIKVDYNLGVTQLGEMTDSVRDVLYKEHPNKVVVIGDTNSTLAGALAAAQLNIPIIHIEAGIRSFDKSMPEEKNRILVDHLSSLLLCPSELAVENLKKEGLEGVFTGDIMADLVKGKRENRGHVFATIHRNFNVDNEDRLREIITYLKSFHAILPAHPRTRKMLDKFKIDTSGVRVIEPLSFKETLKLERTASLIITDSGGVQREAYLLGVPYLVMRPNTEWPQLLLGGKGLLGENVTEKIQKAIDGF